MLTHVLYQLITLRLFQRRVYIVIGLILLGAFAIPVARDMTRTRPRPQSLNLTEHQWDRHWDRVAEIGRGASLTLTELSAHLELQRTGATRK